jgi:cell division septation protein DedD
MKAKNFLPLLVVILLSSLFLVCSSSDEAGRFSKEKADSTMTAANKTPADSVAKRVETQLPEKQVVIKDTTSKIAETEKLKEALYSVQLGAFKEIKNVEKFEKMVKNDFPGIFMKTEPDDASKTYKVTIGKFEAKQDAYKLRDYCVEKGYKDAWVITIPK